MATDAETAGQEATTTQQTAIAAAEHAITRYEEKAAGAGGATIDTTGGDRGAPEVPPRAADLADPEDYHSRGLAYAEADELDDGADAAEAEGSAEGEEEAAAAGPDGDATEAEGDATDEAEADSAQEDDTDLAYSLPESDGVEWGDPKSPALRSLMDTAFDKDVSQEQFDVFTTWYSQTIKALQANDPEHAKSARAALTWGDQHASRMAAAKAAFAQAFPDKTLRAQLRQARLPDGRKVANIPEFIRLLADSGKDRAPTVDGRLAEVRKILRTDRGRYDRENLGAELQSLLERAESGSSSAASPAHADPDEQRIAELKRLMRSDRDSYFGAGGDVEYTQLIAKREKRERRKGAA